MIGSIRIFSLVFLLTIICSNNLFARKIQNIISTPENSNFINIEAIDNINSSIEKLENSISGLTEQNEQLTHDYTKSKKETIIILKDLKLQINDLSQKFNKLVEINNTHKIELENIKNTLSIMSNNINNETVKNPTQLLLTNKSNKKENEIELHNNINPVITDIESFNDALSLYNKKEYNDSAIAFATNIKKFNNGKNFYNNLLYLGLSMMELKNNNEACIAFNKILNSNEIIDVQIKEKAKNKLLILNCNK